MDESYGFLGWAECRSGEDVVLGDEDADSYIAERVVRVADSI